MSVSGKKSQPGRAPASDVPLDGVGRRHAQGQRDLQHQGQRGQPARSHAPTPGTRRRGNGYPAGSARPCIVPGLAPRATRCRPLRGLKTGRQAPARRTRFPTSRGPSSSCERMVCQSRDHRQSQPSSLGRWQSPIFARVPQVGLLPRSQVENRVRSTTWRLEFHGTTGMTQSLGGLRLPGGPIFSNGNRSALAESIV